MLHKCKTIIKAMKAATSKQRNIAMGVKNGLDELEELIDAISWNRARSRGAEQARHIRKEVSVPVTRTQAETPNSTQKRTASSPLRRERDARKKRAIAKGQDESPATWNVVRSKVARRKKKEETPSTRIADTPVTATEKNVKKRRIKVRPEAILIRPEMGQSYADVLREIRDKTKPEDTGTKVRSIRQTRSGGVLLEIGEEPREKGAFREAIRTILGDKAVVSSLEPRHTVEIRDLDCLTDEAEVKAALQRDITELGEARIGLTPVNTRGQRVAIVELGEGAAAKLLERQKIQIGWVQCRVRRRAVVTRCFRCLGYGHVARDCKGPDRSGLCYRCGAAGHKAKTCTALQRCVLCAERGLEKERLAHVPGSGRCGVFRDELDKAKALVQ